MKSFFWIVILSFTTSILSHAQLSCPNHALHTAVREGDPFVLRTIINTGLCDINGKNLNAVTPLHLAVLMGNAQMVRILLDNGASVFVKDAFGNEAVVWADITDNDEIVFILKEKEKEAIRSNFVEEFSPKKIENQGGVNIELVQMMIEAGADISEKDRYGYTALHNVALMNETYAAHLLIEAGADINVEHKSGNTPLDIAIMARSYRPSVINIIEMLLDAGANINHDTMTSTIGEDDTEILRMFLDTGLDVNKVAERGFGLTYLHYAAAGGDLKSVKMLIEYGADLNAKNYYKETPFQTAKSRIIQLKDSEDKYGIEWVERLERTVEFFESIE